MTSLIDSIKNQTGNFKVVNAPRVNVVAIILLLLPSLLGGYLLWWLENPIWLVAGVIIGLIAMQSPNVAQQWEKAVVLRLGRYTGLRGPGLFWIVPFLNTISSWIDQRVITTSFAAEETLTSDTVPVNVDAVLFWMVYDPEKAALEVQDYAQAVSWAAQTPCVTSLGKRF
ncbi:MAG: SPFH domain-containing protein [Candidatus Promineifilaceae bacterium]